MRLGVSDSTPPLSLPSSLSDNDEGGEAAVDFSWPPMSATESIRAKTFSAAAADRVKLVMRPCNDWYAEFIMFQYS